MDDLRYGKVETLTDCAARLHSAVDNYVDTATQLRDQVLLGIRPSVVFDEAALRHIAAARHRVDEAFNDYARAAAAGRATVIRALVEDGSLSRTEVARRMGVSRQMVSRLYLSAEHGSAQSQDGDLGIVAD